MKKGYFSKDVFDFLTELKKNNNRQWFLANKDRYEKDVKGAMLAFISDFGGKIKKISPNFAADPRPVGGSMFRIFRDTRFSRDKSPYKTWLAAHFYHRSAGNDVHGTGFYIHLEPGNSVGGGGIWHPDAGTLAKIRSRIANREKDWKVIRAAGIEGDKLIRPPQGYDSNHPFIDDIKHKDFYSMVKFSDKEVCAPDFMDRYLKACQKVGPLVKFLTQAVDLAW